MRNLSIIGKIIVGGNLKCLLTNKKKELFLASEYAPSMRFDGILGKKPGYQLRNYVINIRDINRPVDAELVDSRNIQHNDAIESVLYQGDNYVVLYKEKVWYLVPTNIVPVGVETLQIFRLMEAEKLPLDWYNVRYKTRNEEWVWNAKLKKINKTRGG